MDFSLVCRTCLGGASLNPIFTMDSDNDTYCDAIFIATGVQIKYNDNLPQNMCTDCKNKLNDTLNFRKQCKDVESKLLSFVTDEKPTMVLNKDVQNTTKRKLRYNCDKRDSDAIKNEYTDNMKNVTDVDDDKPLKLLFDSQKSIIKVLTVKEDIENKTNNENLFNNYESKTEIYELGISDDDINEKLLHDNAQTVKSENNGTKNISCSNNSRTTEAPYDLITDPVTQKATKVLCKLCNKELSIRSIDSHMTRRHPGADERKVKCDLCDSYVMKEKLNRHIVMMHGRDNFRCGYCKEEFGGREKLVEHVTSCTAKKRKRKVNEAGRELRECDICHKVMQKASLRMHQAVKHAGLRPVCEHCGKSFGNKFRLNEHYRAKHGYEKFRCSYCDFRSAGVMAMKNHERRHRGEKPFVCETCGAKFHAAYLLTQHKHSHRTEKLVKCDLCPASFKANNSLHMHKLTCHSRAYRCAVCRRSYKCRHYAVKHARHAHAHAPPRPVLLDEHPDNVAT